MSHPGNEHNDERSERVEMDRESMLTMYALGELQADAAAEIEASLADDPAGRAFVASTRGTAALLEASLASENSENAVLTKRQRESVINGPVVEPSTVLRFPGWPRLAAAALAAAACVTLIVTALMVHDGGGSDRGGEMAMKMGEGLEEFGALDDESGPLAAGTAAAPGVSRKRANGEPDLAAVGRDADVVESMIATEPKNDGRRRRDAFVGAPVDSRVDDNAVANGTATTAAAAPPASEPVAAPPASPPKPGGGGGGGGAISGGRSGGNAETPARRRAPSASPNAGRRTEMPRIEQERETRGRTRDIGRGEREQELDREGYAPLTDNAFKRPTVDEYSTFSVDVDTASFSNARRMIDEGRLPPKDAVRIEEFINAFDYDYAEPAEDAPFAIDLAVAPAPWAPDHRLVRIGLKGREIEPEARPATSLVFLVDTSGSMNRPNKLPLVQESLRMLVHALHGDDRIAIVTYAGTSGVALPSTYCMEKERLLDAIHHLRPGGSTNGAAGIQLAYDIAQQHFIEGGVNRVILCTDGDFNVGASSDGELVDLIARKRESGVFLNVLGYGTGNFQDAKMEALSNN
ncbi:MAG: VWA domain-containing protein, partial [Planctomycetota bacterium]